MPEGFQCAPCSRCVTFRLIQAVDAPQYCRVRFAARVVNGRELAPVEWQRHPVSAVSAPLGMGFLPSVSAEVEGAPTQLMVVLIGPSGGVIGAASFTLPDLTTSKQFDLTLDGGAGRLRFVARYESDSPRRSPRNGLAAAASSPPAMPKQQPQTEEPAAWDLFQSLFASFSCTTPRGSCFAFPKVPETAKRAGSPQLR